MLLTHESPFLFFPWSVDIAAVPAILWAYPTQDHCLKRLARGGQISSVGLLSTWVDGGRQSAPTLEPKSCVRGSHLLRF